MAKKPKWVYRKPNHFIEKYDCAEPDVCYDCFWWNSEQCIRELLTEEDIKEIVEKKQKVNDGA